MQGDVLNYRAVQHVVAGSDAVISVLGHTKGSPKDLQLKALLHTLRAMHEHRVKRLIILTGSGVYTKEDKPPILVKLLNFVVKKVYKARVTDAQKLLPVLRASQTDWTVVRVNLLTDQDTSSYHVGLLGDKELKLRTSRKAVASFNTR
jgi:putative NADH-flavin reductase